MFTDLHLKDFAAFADLRWPVHGQVNVIVGENDTGKSHLLKALYAIAACAGAITAKKVKKGDASALFRDKLQWTFQTPPDLGSLIHAGAMELEVEARLAGNTYAFDLVKKDEAALFTLGSDTHKGVDTSAVFLPPKEVLTIFAAIEVSRSIHEIYGFDDTYYDLLKLLRIPPTRGKIAPDLSAVMSELEGFFGGRILKKGSADEFSYERDGRVYSMPQTADGIKKLGILTTLIRNRSLKKGSILFVDEPETNLHPRAISLFTTMLFRLGQAGVQVYLATHSYFVIKQLEILAKEHGSSVPFCSLLRLDDQITAAFSDLRDGMADNPIIEESLRLYQREIDVDLAIARRARG